MSGASQPTADVELARAGVPTARVPRVWVLLGKGAGGNAQMLALAEALGWPYEAKRLAYNILNLCPNLVLGSTAVSLRRKRCSPLRPPWPDLVIAASRRSAPIAQWIKKRSGGHTRLVHLLHAQAPLHRFDLIITLPQYRLPARSNVLHLTAPLNRIDPHRLEQAAARWAPRLRHLPRPLIALLVGGNSSSYILDRVTAHRLGREVSRYVQATGGALLLTTSPRTRRDAVKALFEAVDCPTYRYAWCPEDPDNPYLGFLRLADRFIVTADSASLAIEACATGKPVAVYYWPGRRRGRRRADHRADAGVQAAGNRLGESAFQWLVYWGLIKPARDFAAYHRVLEERGLITAFGEQAASATGQPLDDMERAVARIRQLMSRGSIAAEAGKN
ncbi:mitochondrial fission ELM1 family protein [Nitrococcus mobilis]|uniref:Predicted nucleoside-diphosphate-sugar epimerase n=1 Tax=Nitrococcus mobilis Nb-231 TaxID=314278 RepID=A4BPR0_9GAMM|nr:mitochondrial fission ELM1 family protein [Nitrococcus mobilis]EAR22065.1 Predicted nucleoside-diphosphate-sugar epimerase [Nitrococcus mobilis Nb-231]